MGADFRDAQCQGVDFKYAQCQKAVFRDVQCQKADFGDARCRGAVFFGYKPIITIKPPKPLPKDVKVILLSLSINPMKYKAIKITI
jgi:hypothetical protein